MTHLHPHRTDDDQIFQKYLDRAIEEINDLNAQISSQSDCERRTLFQPVVGTGHPLADVFLLKYTPRPDEQRAGVAFHGRAGEAILKSARRLNVDPLDLYGTNCVKCGEESSVCGTDHSVDWLQQEISIVNPKLVVVMGERALECLNTAGGLDADHLVPLFGSVQRWTHTCEALYCPDVDASFAGVAAKLDFWRAFRTLGEWYDDRPPY